MSTSSVSAKAYLFQWNDRLQVPLILRFTNLKNTALAREVIKTGVKLYNATSEQSLEALNPLKGCFVDETTCFSAHMVEQQFALLALQYAKLLSPRGSILSSSGSTAVSNVSLQSGYSIIPALEGNTQLILNEEFLIEQLAAFSPEALQVAVMLEASASILSADSSVAVKKALGDNNYLTRIACGPGVSVANGASFTLPRPLVAGGVKTMNMLPSCVCLPFIQGISLCGENIADRSVRQDGVMRSDTFSEYLSRQISGIGSAEKVLKKHFFQSDGTCLVRYDDTTVLVTNAQENQLMLRCIGQLAEAPMDLRDFFSTDFSGVNVPSAFAWGRWVDGFLLSFEVGGKEWVMLVKKLKFSEAYRETVSTLYRIIDT
jgi:hypothetical protein